MLINCFKGFDSKKLVHLRLPNNSNVCQLCNLVDHSAFACFKLFDRPKCCKCKGGHKMENCGHKCTYYFGLGCTKKWCWKKNGRRLAMTTNYLEVLVNDEKNL
jgi:hypothetical protein